MKNLTRLIIAAVTTLGLAAAAVPVIAQQTHMRPGKMMGAHSGHGGHSGMGMMGMMMGGAQSHMMAKFDTDEDGTLSPEEMTAGIQAEIKTYDTDSNGSLSLEEFAAMHAAHTRPMTVRVFQMHDPDGDAQVTESEMAATAEMMQNHMGRMPDGMPGMGNEMMDNN